MLHTSGPFIDNLWGFLLLFLLLVGFKEGGEIYAGVGHLLKGSFPQALTLHYNETIEVYGKLYIYHVLQVLKITQKSKNPKGTTCVLG